MPTYKYTYFNLKGRGEIVRLCFAAAGIKFEDKRVGSSDWPALKPKTLWGQLPILEVDGKELGESMTIARYVARQGGLMGKNDFEAATIESVTDVITAIREKFFGMHTLPDADKPAAIKEFLEKTLPPSMSLLEKFAAKNKEKPGCFVGSKMSLADLQLYSIFEILLTQKADVLNGYPSVKQIYDTVAADPKVAAYLKTRPATPF